jgi:uncharacterized protein YydD (DUF2326 family)
MKKLTFNDVEKLETDLLAVSKQKDILNQKLMEEREAKDRELSELKKRMSEYEQSFASVKNMQDQINQLRSQILTDLSKHQD